MKNQHSEEQIITIFGESERAALEISDARQPHGISELTYDRWPQKSMAEWRSAKPSPGSSWTRSTAVA
jgi:hypothetical protein